MSILIFQILSAQCFPFPWRNLEQFLSWPLHLRSCVYEINMSWKISLRILLSTPGSMISSKPTDGKAPGMNEPFLEVFWSTCLKTICRKAIWDVGNELHHWMPCKVWSKLVIKGSTQSGLNQSQWGITSSNSSTQERQLHTPKVHAFP
jgi:hypothetical protein